MVNSPKETPQERKEEMAEGDEEGLPRIVEGIVESALSDSDDQEEVLQIRRTPRGAQTQWKAEKSPPDGIGQCASRGPGPGSWKLNCYMLENVELMEELGEEYVLWREQQRYFGFVEEWWEYVKVKFRSFFQAKGRQQVSKWRRDFKTLQRDLQCLQDLHLKGWNVKKNLEETKKRLEGHFEEEARRIVFRSKVEHLEKGEKFNSFFFRKLHSGHTPLSELQDETGAIRKGKKDVMQVVSDYYTGLYSPKTTDDEVAERFLSELFAESIRQNPEIRGISAPGPGRREVKCSLYMDDVTVFCADQRSISALVQTCEDFDRASGAKVNCGKSEALLFRNWHLSSPVPFSVKPDFTKILGV
ncbi:uncharacterized protein PAF06_009673 [Gastrophryne carolinensis]